MDDAGDILISLEERHTANVLAGRKSVELRRKLLNIGANTRVWIYSKLPRGQIQALAVVDEVVADEPNKLWKRFGTQSAISKSEFDTYFLNVNVGCAIIFQDVIPLAPILYLSSIRTKFADFHPPQFFMRLEKDRPELSFFKTALVTD